MRRRAGIATAAVAVIGAAMTWTALPGGAVEWHDLNTGAAPFDASSPNQGWWSDNRSNLGTNPNYTTGTMTGIRRRSYFTFDLSGVEGRILSARLEVVRGRNVNTEAVERFGLFDVSTSASVLNAGGAGSPSIYADLGSGTSFGEFDIHTAGSSTDVLGFQLNGDGVTALNAAIGGFFSMGGSLLSDDGADALFTVTTTAGAQRLVLEVQPIIPVTIDVRPGAKDAPLPPNGVVPVAVLSQDDFDATTMLVGTVKLGPGEATPDGDGSVHDVNGDGRPDVLLRFRLGDTGLQPSDSEACLIGDMVDGMQFTGCDTVRVLATGHGSSRKP